MSEENSKVSVVMASYNESANIAEAIERISVSLQDSLHEIIVVDDDSPDLTWKIIEEFKNPKYKVIRRINQRGLASALKTGLEAASGDVVVWLDCDLGIPPEEIPNLVNKIPEHDVVIGSRYVEGGKDLRSPFRAFLSTALNYYAMAILGRKVRDYTSGFIAVKKEVLDNVKFTPKGFGEYFVEFAYGCVKRNYKIGEVGYIYSDRKGGVSKSDGDMFTLFKYGFQYGYKILQYRFKTK